MDIIKRIDASQWQQQDLVEEISRTTVPLVFTGLLTKWPISTWKWQDFVNNLGHKATTARFHKHRLDSSNIIWENDCEYRKITLKEFIEWICTPCKDKLSVHNPLCDMNTHEYFGYCDYKDLDEFLPVQDIRKLLKWEDTFGIKGNSSEPTIWIGSKGAYTQLHYDTYSVNLVAQIVGKKRWTLFSPSQSKFLYPTRLPYEESSVFSNVPLGGVDLEKFPKFAQATPVEIILQEGEVLYLPKHWWHHVECLESSVSINLWVDSVSDPNDRLKESVVRLLLTSLKNSEGSHPDEWLLPAEYLQDFHTNLIFLQNALKQIKKDKEGQISTQQIYQCLLSSDVIDLIVQKLLQL